MSRMFLSRILSMCLALALLACCGCRELMDPKAATPKKPGPKQLTVAYVLEVYQKDADDFKKRFRDSQILVQGRVDSVGTGNDGGWIVLGSDTGVLRCEFPAFRVPDLTDVRRGEELAVLGICKLADGQPKLTECTVIRAMHLVPKQ